MKQPSRVAVPERPRAAVVLQCRGFPSGLRSDGHLTSGVTALRGHPVAHAHSRFAKLTAPSLLSVPLPCTHRLSWSLRGALAMGLHAAFIKLADSLSKSLCAGVGDLRDAALCRRGVTPEVPVSSR
jgi:hypothetical protein